MTTGESAGPPAEKKYKLYHRLSQAESAEVRRLVQELALLDELQFANVEVGERDLGELRSATGGGQTPVLRVSQSEWFVGRAAIFKYFGR